MYTNVFMLNFASRLNSTYIVRSRRMITRDPWERHLRHGEYKFHSYLDTLYLDPLYHHGRIGTRLKWHRDALGTGDEEAVRSILEDTENKIDCAVWLRARAPRGESPKRALLGKGSPGAYFLSHRNAVAVAKKGLKRTRWTDGEGQLWNLELAYHPDVGRIEVALRPVSTWYGEPHTERTTHYIAPKAKGVLYTASEISEIIKKVLYTGKKALPAIHVIPSSEQTRRVKFAGKKSVLIK
jgi:hypothetical protein